MLDEGLEVIRELWPAIEIHHSGEHYRVEGVTFIPPPVQRPPSDLGRGGVAEPQSTQACRPLARSGAARLPGPRTLEEIFAIVGHGKET